PYQPRSPYAASKAASDHLVRAWAETYGIPSVISNCSNNYGPYQFPEKLIPLMIQRASQGDKLPVYGDGKNVRDWIHVDDHNRAVRTVLEKGEPGQVYNIGANEEYENIEIVQRILSHLGKSDDLIEFVKDRPGHDRRYAMDSSKIRRELSWEPKVSFQEGISDTIDWYLNHRSWWEKILSGEYRNFFEEQYGRVGE
ncbi:MAG: GDP-mannose 4,6-dehydratase, partial [Candidatus Krumholzibacteria bacterium]|nr:GDP-mannose 4,6-dehydratase [Candidatus Krumholzibacteria bacterium]